MKLRLQTGSLRLRLSQSDIARLNDTGKVEETISFAPGADLLYIIETAAVPSLTATFNHAEIRVSVPHTQAQHWIGSDQTGIEASTPTLRLLIEKDFQCLHRDPEPGEDSFPNPLANES